MAPVLSAIRRRAAPVILLVGGAIAAFVVMPRVPRERTIQLRVEGHSSVTGVDVTWTPQDAAERSDAVQGTSWRFEPGKAPPALDTPVRLPDGRYVLDVSVARGSETEAFRRVITLDDTEHVTVRLR